MRSADDGWDDAHTPRRSVRVPDEIWDPAVAAASAAGETITAVIRRALARYALEGGGDAEVEYRATPKDDRFDAVTNIVGAYEDVRRLYPARRWVLEERTVSGYRPAGRQRTRPRSGQ
ncbi:uncharacterized protein RMCN_0869 [Mycolicibacterium novocastrense]|uniref:Ribbon-helix-helix protein CopG domain-containing protein n=1 Tax=Mycolicibacterium novocastrense TaxID=59813 RepID=A0ABQ0KDW6_MYCNV|nr:uncharacterized protein RMCN_0869 [Mycolicibacterium novocastrense]